MIQETKTMMIIPKNGLKIRSDRPPHAAIPIDTPTRVIKNSYWIKRLKAGDVELFENKKLVNEENQEEAVDDSGSDSSNENAQVQTETKSRKKRKDK